MLLRRFFANNKEYIFLALSCATLVGVLSIPIWEFYQGVKEEQSQRWQPSPIIWHDARIEVRYKDEARDTFDICVYESLDNINVTDGNLSFQQSTRQTGGAVAFRRQLCSYVKSFKVLKDSVTSK
jgi:hypothetical protein